LSQLKWFNDIDLNKSVKKQILGVAVAAGVVSSFGTPFGGIIFSIEVTATYYMVSSLWKAFFCATCTLVCFKMFHSLHLVTLFNHTHYEPIPVDHEVIFFCLLGLLSGWFASVYCLILTKMVFLRVKLK